MLKQRIITALWSIPLLVITAWFGQPWFTILLAIWGLSAVFEFYRMMANSPGTQVKPLTYLGLISTLLFIVSPHFRSDFFIPFLLTLTIMVLLIALLIRQQREGAFVSWAWTVGGIFYIGWLLSRLVALRYLENGRSWVLFTFAMTIITDTVAYFVGQAFGKHHLAPRISPNKTWEGAIAGVLGAIIIGVLAARFLPLPISYLTVILLAALVSVFGQAGDLVKSLLKRNMQVKDTGKLLPGHGGALDRLDSVVFAGVVVYYYVIWLIH